MSSPTDCTDLYTGMYGLKYRYVRTYIQALLLYNSAPYTQCHTYIQALIYRNYYYIIHCTLYTVPIYKVRLIHTQRLCVCHLIRACVYATLHIVPLYLIRAHVYATLHIVPLYLIRAYVSKEGAPYCVISYIGACLCVRHVGTQAMLGATPSARCSLTHRHV